MNKILFSLAFFCFLASYSMNKESTIRKYIPNYMPPHLREIVFKWDRMTFAEIQQSTCWQEELHAEKQRLLRECKEEYDTVWKKIHSMQCQWPETVWITCDVQFAFENDNAILFQDFQSMKPAYIDYLVEQVDRIEHAINNGKYRKAKY